MKNKKIVIGLEVFGGLVLLAALIIPCFFGNFMDSLRISERNWVGPIYYSAILLLSLLVLFVFIFIQKNKNLWVLLTFIFSTITFAGYLGISLSDDISKALLANRISYFGNVFLLPFLFLTLTDICKVKIKKVFNVFLFAIAFVMFAFSALQGHLDLFYKEVSLEKVNGFVRINKVYGPLHTVYIVYVCLCVALILGFVVYVFIKKKTPSVFATTAMFIIALVNTILWLIERKLPYTVEYIASSFLLSEILLLVIYKNLEKKGAFDICKITFAVDNKHEVQITMNNIQHNTLITQENIELPTINEEEFKSKLDEIFGENTLTDREKEVACLIVKGYKRREIADKLFISEETVKTHTKHIFRKLNVSSHIELKQRAQDSLKSPK